jgi:DNA-damage-inducible protein J
MVSTLTFDVRHPQYTEEIIRGMEEARKISSGEIEAKSYHSAEELFKNLDQEYC